MLEPWRDHLISTFLMHYCSRELFQATFSKVPAITKDSDKR